jgi:hypothetical protein
MKANPLMNKHFCSGHKIIRFGKSGVDITTPKWPLMPVTPFNPKDLGFLVPKNESSKIIQVSGINQVQNLYDILHGAQKVFTPEDRTSLLRLIVSFRRHEESS